MLPAFVSRWRFLPRCSSPTSRKMARHCSTDSGLPKVSVEPVGAAGEVWRRRGPTAAVNAAVAFVNGLLVLLVTRCRGSPRRSSVALRWWCPRVLSNTQTSRINDFRVWNDVRREQRHGLLGLPTEL